MSRCDIYEYDDSLDQAAPFPLGSLQVHAFCAASDHDWMTFTVTTPGKYRVDTLYLAPGVDTYLELYRGSDMTRMAFDDDGGDEIFASSIAMQLLQPGVYYIKAQQYK